MELFNLLQRLAMVVTITASWLVASSNERRRSFGLWVFPVSNALWIARGWLDGAMAPIAQLVGLAAMNSRGAVKTGKTRDTGSTS